MLGPNLAACARDLYHRYHDCKDADSYLAGEILNDVILLPADNSMVYAILACGDCAVSIQKKKHINSNRGLIFFNTYFYTS